MAKASGRQPKTVDFKIRLIRRPGSPRCSSESCGNRVWVAPTVKDGHNINDRFFDSIVDCKRKTLGKFAVLAKFGCVDSRFLFQTLQILEQTIREVVAEAFALLLLEQRTLKKIAAGFNSQLDVHRSLPRFQLSLPPAPKLAQ